MADSDWHLSKGVPVTTLGGLFLATAAGLGAWYDVSGTVEHLDSSYKSMDSKYVSQAIFDEREKALKQAIQTQVDVHSRDSQAQKESNARVEKGMEQILEHLIRSNGH